MSLSDHISRFVDLGVLRPRHESWSIPLNLTDYLNSVGPTAGAEVTWQETNNGVYSNFVATGKQAYCGV